MRPLNLAINHQPTFNTTLFFTFFYEHCSPFWVILWVSYIDLLPLQLCSSTCWTLLQCSLLLLFFAGSTVLPSLSYTPGYSWTLDSIHCSDYLPVLDIWLCLFFAQSWFLVLCSFAVSGVFPSTLLSNRALFSTLYINLMSFHNITPPLIKLSSYKA